MARTLLAWRWCRGRPTYERADIAAKLEVDRNEPSAATQVFAIRSVHITRAGACVISRRRKQLVVAA